MFEEQEAVLRVDILDPEARFVTSAECELRLPSGGGPWGGVLTHVEPYAHLSSGQYRLRLRDGVEAEIHIQGRQRVGQTERYPFVGAGDAPPLSES